MITRQHTVDSLAARPQPTAQEPTGRPAQEAAAQTIAALEETNEASQSITRQVATHNISPSGDTLSAAPRRMKKVKQDSLLTEEVLITTEPVDTLTVQPEQVATAVPSFLFGKSNSLRILPGGVPDPRYRTAEASEVFGASAYAAFRPPQMPSPAPSLTESPVFQSFVLILAIAYALLIYNNMNDICILFNRASHDTANSYRLSDDQRNSGFSRFLNITTIIGLLFLGVISVKYSDVLLPSALLETLSEGAVLVMTIATVVIFMFVVTYQWLLLRLTGAIILAQPLFSQLIQLKRGYLALTVIVVSPILLLFSLCPKDTGMVWFYSATALLIITTMLFLKETLLLFISKKISILHWFLYLCAVEIFPISFILLLAVR